VRTPNSVEHNQRLAVGSSAGLVFERGSASVLLD